jgi:two-component system, LytTR family, response regulator
MNITFSCIIVDDERPAREELSSLLAKYEHISILALCNNVDDAIEKINLLHPDVVFLDINMPSKSGFDLIEALKNPPSIIFCTAYDEFAIKAFEENAIDYLLKPVTPDRLYKSIERLQNYFIRTKEANNQQKKIFIKDGKKIFYTALEDIFLIESSGNYVKYYFEKNIATIRKTFKEAEEEFSVLGFIAINRNQLVNKNFITTKNDKIGRNLTLNLKNGLTLTASRSKSNVLK